ncbi:MAG: hypothetical protein AB1847_15700 [bacterium]
MHKGERGVALMMVLWVMILLGFIALEFAHSMRTEVEVTKTFRDEIQAYYLARAGIEIGRYELAICGQEKGHYSYPESEEQVFGLGDDGEVRMPFSCRSNELGGGKYHYKFKDAGNKLPLNKLADPANYSKSVEMIKKFLESSCKIDPFSEESSNISRSIMDWVDDDHVIGGSTQTGGSPGIGAEDDWYKSHDRGYECKDAPFDSEGELSLIRGLRIEDDDNEEEAARKKEIVSAFKRNYKVNNDLDNEGRNPQADIFYNTARPEVIKNAYDIGWPRSLSPEEVERQKELNGGIYDKAFAAGYYQIISTGIIKNSPVQRHVMASFLVQNRDYWKPLSWNDNYIPKYDEEIKTDVLDQPDEEKQ